MKVYLDASVAVSLFTADAHTPRAKSIALREELVISDLTEAEFSSALAIQHRVGNASDPDIRAIYRHFDDWCEATPERVETLSADIRTAQSLIRRLDNALRTADAAHIAIASRLGLSIATFDMQMARQAARLGLRVVDA